MQGGRVRPRRRGSRVDERAYPVTAGIRVEGSGSPGPEWSPSVTVVVPTKNAARNFDMELVVVPRRLGHRRPFEALEGIEERLTTPSFANAVWVMRVAILAVFCGLPVSRWHEAPRIAGAPVIVDPLVGAVEVPEQ